MSVLRFGFLLLLLTLPAAGAETATQEDVAALEARLASRLANVTLELQQTQAALDGLSLAAEQNHALCKLLSRTAGRTLFWVLRARWDRLEASQVIPHLAGLDLVLVGGLKTRGWTTHDVDVVGLPEAVAALESRLRAVGILNPVHHCNSHAKHSHFACIRGGLKALFSSLDGQRAGWLRGRLRTLARRAVGGT